MRDWPTNNVCAQTCTVQHIPHGVAFSIVARYGPKIGANFNLMKIVKYTVLMRSFAGGQRSPRRLSKCWSRHGKLKCDAAIDQ
jgi:hypothetical protein